MLNDLAASEDSLFYDLLDLFTSLEDRQLDSGPNALREAGVVANEHARGALCPPS